MEIDLELEDLVTRLASRAEQVDLGLVEIEVVAEEVLVEEKDEVAGDLGDHLEVLGHQVVDLVQEAVQVKGVDPEAAAVDLTANFLLCHCERCVAISYFHW